MPVIYIRRVTKSRNFMGNFQKVPLSGWGPSPNIPPLIAASQLTCAFGIQCGLLFLNPAFAPVQEGIKPHLIPGQFRFRDFPFWANSEFSKIFTPESGI